MQAYSCYQLLAALPPHGSALPDLPPGPSLDRVRGPIEIPLYEPWQIALMCALATIALGLLGWGMVRLLRTRRHATRQTPAHQTALAELQAAATFTTDDDERFAMLSSLAVRRYFETGMGIAALGRTSLECLKELDCHPQLNAEARTSLSEFLEHCDRVKFARASLTAAERQALTTSATELIRHVEQAATPTPTETMHA